MPLPEIAAPVELAESDARAARTLLDIAPAEFASALERRAANRAALISWVREALVPGVDFGRIPTKRGMSKPSLWKPGSEKICGMLGVTATFPSLNDYEHSALDGRHIEQVILRCHLMSASGQTLADGVGARSLDQDGGDLNKALKMCAKSAMIDATLRLAGLSEVFTQDLEDVDPQAWRRQDPKLVKVAAERLAKCFTSDTGEVDDAKLTELLGELGGVDQNFKLAVWNELPKSAREYIREHHTGDT